MALNRVCTLKTYCSVYMTVILAHYSFCELFSILMVIDLYRGQSNGPPVTLTSMLIPYSIAFSLFSFSLSLFLSLSHTLTHSLPLSSFTGAGARKGGETEVGGHGQLIKAGGRAAERGKREECVCVCV